MNQLKHYRKQFTAILLIFPLFFGIIPLNTKPINAAVNPVHPDKPSLVSKSDPFPARPIQKNELYNRRTANTRQFINPDGSFTAEVFRDSIYYQDESKTWKNIDNKIKSSDKADFAYQNGNNRYKIYFSANTGQGKMGHFEYKNTSLDFVPQNASKATANVKDDTIYYNSVFNNVDLYYQVLADELKGSIILQSPTAQNQFSFLLGTNLSHKELDDGSIAFYTPEDSKNAAFTIPKPFMFEDGEEPAASQDVQQHIRKDGDKIYLDITADSKWLKDPARKYPVTIDPTIILQPDAALSKDTFASSYEPGTAHNNLTFLIAGNHAATYGTTRSYCWYQLPGLPDGAQIDSASLSFNMYLNLSDNTKIELHKVTSDWDQASLTWNNQPTYAANSESFVSGNTIGWWNFDITNLVSTWYQGTQPNYGVALLASPESANRRGFRSANYTTDISARPKLTINYTVNPTGDQDFWTYTDDGVNPFNGNLMIRASDLFIPGRGIEVGVDRAYNSQSAGDLGVFGYGWRSNLDMYIAATGKGPILFWDNSGTKHVFAQNQDGTYLPPPGIHMSLLWDAVNSVYKITTLDNTVYTFDNSGYIINITDSNQQTITYNRNANHQITSMTDPSGRISYVYYNANGFMDHITESAGRTISYSYDGLNNLNQVTITSGESSTNIKYGYSSGTHTLTSFTDANNNTVSYGYNGNGRIYTVTRVINGSNSTNTYTYSIVNEKPTTIITGPLGRSAIYTFNDNGNLEKSEVIKDDQGNKLTSSYTWDNHNNLFFLIDPNNHQTVLAYDTSGQIISITDANKINRTLNYDLNHNLVTVKDPKGSVTASDFDQKNNESDSYDSLGNGSISEYDSNGNVKSSSLPISLGENLLYNPGFEDQNAGIPWGWLNNRSLNSGESFTTDASTKAGGYNSLKVTSTSTGGLGVRSSYYTPVIGGASYNLSADLKTDNNSIALLKVYWFKDTNGTPATIDNTGNLSVSTGISSWSRKATQVLTPADAAYAKVEIMVNGVGNVWFDNLQFETGSGRMGNNLLINSGFDNDLDQTGLADGWYPPDPNPGGINIDFSISHSGPAAEQMNGSTGVDRYVSQTLNIFGDAGTKLAFSGWAKSTGGSVIADSNFAMAVVFNYDDGSKQWLQVTFDPSNPNWQQLSKVIRAEKSFNSITVYANYDNQTGSAWFDDFEVHKYNTVSSVASAYNYLENASFEKDLDSTNWPDGWPKSTEPGKSAAFSWSALENAYTGEKSVSISNPTGLSTISSNRKIPYDKTKTYTVVGYAKTQALSSSAALMVRCYDASGQLLKDISSSSLTGDKNWTRLSLIPSSSEFPAQTAAIAVGVQVQAGSGSAYFDNLRLLIGELRSRYEYNSGGNYVNRITDPLGYVTSLDPDDNSGNLNSLTDPRGNTVSYSYDFLDRVKTVSFPYQATIGGATVNKTNSYGYDGNSNLTLITNPNNKSISLSYNEIDELSNVSENVSGVARNIILNYDALGNLTRMDHPNGSFASLVYDKANRLTGVNYGTGQTITDSYTYVYDNAGNLTGYTKGGLTNSLVYDNIDRLQSSTEPGGVSKIEYEYDAADNRTSFTETVAPGTVWSVDYSYDERSQISQIKDNTFNKHTCYLYNESGQLIKTYNEYNSYGLSTYYSYDNNGQILDVRMQNAGGYTTCWLNYSYDANGNITQIYDSLNGNYAVYTYDSQNQLVRELYQDGTSITYAYDELGNRTEVDRNGSKTTYVYNSEKNRLTSVAGVNYTYDNAGNLTSDEHCTYQWNNANQLNQVNGQNTTAYTYDALGRRDSKTVNGTTEYFHYDGDRVSYSTNASGVVLRRFTYDDNGRPVYMGQNNTIYYYHYNGHGDVIRMTDLSGNSVADYSYDAWGNITSETGSFETPK